MKVWFAAELVRFTANYSAEHIKVYLNKPQRGHDGRLPNDYVFFVRRGDAAKILPDFVANMRAGDEPIWGYLDIDFGYRKEESA